MDRVRLGISNLTAAIRRLRETTSLGPGSFKLVPLGAYHLESSSRSPSQKDSPIVVCIRETSLPVTTHPLCSSSESCVFTLQTNTRDARGCLGMLGTPRGSNPPTGEHTSEMGQDGRLTNADHTSGGQLRRPASSISLARNQRQLPPPGLIAMPALTVQPVRPRAQQSSAIRSQLDCACGVTPSLRLASWWGYGKQRVKNASPKY